LYLNFNLTVNDIKVDGSENDGQEQDDIEQDPEDIEIELSEHFPATVRNCISHPALDS